MELTKKQIAFYKGYILPSILEFYKDVDCLEKFKSIEGIDTYFKSFIEKISLVNILDTVSKNFERHAGNYVRIRFCRPVK